MGQSYILGYRGPETWDDCDKLVREFLTESLDIDGATDDAIITIERAHRLGRKAGKSGGKARGVIVIGSIGKL
jgi:hypothetical protein